MQKGHSVALAMLDPTNFLPLFTTQNNDMYGKTVVKTIDLIEFFSTSSFVVASFLAMMVLIAFSTLCIVDSNNEFLD